MLLPQELYAEAIWTEWWSHYGVLCSDKIKELLQKYNLKLRKDKSIDDIRLAFGRGLKNAHNSSLQIKQIAEEVDKVCIIANWEYAVARYKRNQVKDGAADVGKIKES